MNMLCPVGFTILEDMSHALG